MKKKMMLLCIMMVLSIMLISCGSEGKNTNNGEIALVVATGTIDDKSFNQGAWEGIKEYADANKVSYKYYQATDQSETALLNAIDLAVLGGAKLVVCPGYLFEKPLYQAQVKYPDTTFVMLDGSPSDAEGTVKIEKNTATYTYAEEQAGFLAGYAAVQDGYRKLGFMGGIAVPSVVRFGYGFVQGAEYAAKELGLSKNAIEINYTYLGTFDASPDITVKASSWYANGTEVIFACGGSVGNSVMSAASQAGTKVIGVDIDQSEESETVVTSAMKNIKKTVFDAVEEFYKQTLVTGTSTILNVKTDSVLLPMETSRFQQFTKEQYDNIYQELIDGKVTVQGDSAFKNVTEIPVEYAKVTETK